MKCLQEFPILFFSNFETSKHITSPILTLSLMSLSFLPKAGLAAAYAARDFKLPCTVAMAELFEGCYFWISFLLAITCVIHLATYFDMDGTAVLAYGW